MSAGGLSAIFDIFGGEGGSGVFTAVANLISSAVIELERYMDGLHLQSSENDASAFFHWYANNFPSSGEMALTDAAVAHIENVLLPALEAANSYVHGSLFNNLLSCSSKALINVGSDVNGAAVHYDQDLAHTVVMMTLTALIGALKLQIQLRAALASYYAPDPVFGRCESLTADSNFQKSTFEWLDAVSQLKSLIGSPDLIESLNPQDRVRLSVEMTEGMARVIATNEPDARALIASVAKRFTADRAYYLLYAPPPIWDASFDLQTWAGGVGWALAVAMLCAWRVEQQWTITNTYGGSWVGLYFGAAAFLSRVGGVWRLHENLVASTDPLGIAAYPSEDQAIEAWLDWQRAKWVTVAGYPDDLQTAMSWRTGLIGILQRLPPGAPASNEAVISTWNGAAPANSVWSKAHAARYAFSQRNKNGPSLRSTWTAAINIRPSPTDAARCKPELHHIPQSQDSAVSIEVWRQFIFRDTNDQPVEGVPQIVARLTGPTPPIFTDTDLGSEN